jgi:hypothetical protein
MVDFVECTTTARSSAAGTSAFDCVLIKNGIKTVNLTKLFFIEPPTQVLIAEGAILKDNDLYSADYYL